MGYVFISYSSKNLEYADAMRNLLKNIGVKTWMAPGDIPAGSTYAGVITRALKGSDCLVLLLTDDSQKSTWVDKEVGIEITETMAFQAQSDWVIRQRKDDRWGRITRNGMDLRWQVNGI